jgi:hypothetical protein
MRYVPYVYFLRIPLFLAVALVLLPFVGLLTAQPTIDGFFDLDWPGVFDVSLAACLFGAMLSVTTCLVLLYGRLRFFAAPLSEEDLASVWYIGPLGIPRAARLFIVGYALCVAVLLVGAVIGPGAPPGKSGRAAAASAAVAVFFIVLYGVARAWAALTSAATTWIAKRLTWTPWGYLKLSYVRPERCDVDHHEWPFVEPPELLPGHGFALCIAALSALFYALFAFGRYWRLSRIESNQPGGGFWIGMPTLGSIILLLSLFLLVVGALAFLLDRYRIPVILPIAFLLVLTAQFGESDHFYDVVKLTRTQPYPVSESLIPRTGGSKDGVILIATAGGGIHAAAWTARVLSGLVEEIKDDRFAKSIAAISSVSGGSVGTLFFTHAYDQGRVDASLTEKIFEAAAASSLDDTAWGLVYPDVWRCIAPFLLSSRLDRGWAMETAWLEQLSNIRRVNSWPTLGEWRDDARAGLRPALIFNSTLVETGERFLFSTVDLEKANTRRALHDLDGYADLDLRANTAARLSATFPWVTPVSRASCCPPRSQRFHVADGGYYDNFGMSSIAELIRQGTANQAAASRILIIQIRLAPEGGYGTAKGSRGWFFQAFAPITTLVKMRDAAQASRNQIELDLLTDNLKRRSDAHAVQISQVQFPYKKPDTRCGEPRKSRTDPPEQPLSWHLTPANIDDIRDTWKQYVCTGKEIADIKSFLGIANEHQ